MDTLIAILNGIGRIFVAMVSGAIDGSNETTDRAPSACVDALEAEGKSYNEIDPLF